LFVNPKQIEQLRADIVRTSRRVHANGWVANHDGNLSARLSEERVLCTPTAVSKGDVEPSWLIVVDNDNKVVEGTRRSFSELQIHRAAYAARPDITVVIHAHPPISTGFAVAGVPFPHPIMAEPVVSLGPEVPMVPYFQPGSPALSDAIGAALQRADVIILERHGVLAVGGGFEQAYLRMELVEHIARIGLAAQQIGQVRFLSPSEVKHLARRGRPESAPAREVANEIVKAALSPAVPGVASVSKDEMDVLVKAALDRLN
jgi:L-fuculose-phosphate aldolase